MRQTFSTGLILAVGERGGISPKEVTYTERRRKTLYSTFLWYQLVFNFCSKELCCTVFMENMERRKTIEHFSTLPGGYTAGAFRAQNKNYLE